MQVLCVASAEPEAAIVCPICGQQYDVYYSRNAPAECAAALALIKRSLMEHHQSGGHPAEAFTLPPWPGDPFSSGAAMLGGARPQSKASAAPRPIRVEVPIATRQTT
jgi:hypothetical protein